MKLSPQPRPWSRLIVISILLALTVRYVLWRSLYTLNFSNPLEGAFSLGLWLMELLIIISSMLQWFLMLGITNRRLQADRLSQVGLGIHPSVDILIPTYNEPDFILRRTVIGCQAIEYDNKQVYLLDDTRRPMIQRLAQELGCHYVTRPDNRYAKAGNLNHAIAQTTGELIAVFDADFIATKNFLKRTIGFFQNPKIALVQTPQTFYNHDPVARNLGLEGVIPPEEEVFYRLIQPIKDGAGSVVCAGTSFVVRRSTLEAVGGFVTSSLSEDYFTGIRLCASGAQVIYLNEKLSAGLAAESISDHIAQRVRWIRGTLQAFYIDSNPLTIPGLRLRQRIGHLEGLLHWLISVPRLSFLLVPLIYSFFGIMPILVTSEAMLSVFLPYYLVQLSVFAWLNERSRSAILTDIYAFILCIPLSVALIQVLCNPFGKVFQVTPKGIARNQYSINYWLALPLFILLIATVASFWLNLNNPATESLLGLVWSVYNSVMLSVALLALIDVPTANQDQWFKRRQPVQIISNASSQWGMMTMLSEAGAEIELRAVNFASPVIGTAPLIPTPSFNGAGSELSEYRRRHKLQSAEMNAAHSSFIACDRRPAVVKLQLAEARMKLQGQVTTTQWTGQCWRVRVKFEAVSTWEQRRLIELLYCRPGQWQDVQTPGEWRSLWLLVRVLLRPLVGVVDFLQSGKRIRGKR